MRAAHLPRPLTCSPLFRHPLRFRQIPLPPPTCPNTHGLFQFTHTRQPTDAVSTLSVPTSSSGNPPTGKIVFTCQIFKVQASNQICIINADGTGFRRLTNDSTRQHYYPSLAPDGKSVVYAAFAEENVYEIYEMDLSGGFKQLTKKLGILNAPGDLSQRRQYYFQILHRRFR